jgi:hypothetical protein
MTVIEVENRLTELGIETTQSYIKTSKSGVMFCVVSFSRYVPPINYMAEYHTAMYDNGWRLIAASTDTTFHYMKEN